MRKTMLLAFAMLAVSRAAEAADPTGAAMPSTSPPAPIVFFDIAGPDAAKLKAFYAGNFGWSLGVNGPIKTGNLDGALRQDPAEKILYIGVPDIDAAMKNVAASGGAIVTSKISIPSGVFVLFTDPAGNRMGLFQAKAP
jgi:predicted enzyme related to lactoylglutathione lyase